MPLTARWQRAACRRTKYAASSGTSSRRSRRRRNGEGHDVQPVVEVSPKRAVRDGLLEVAIRGRDHSNVDLDAAARADALDDLVLQDAEELGLQRRRQLADLVEKHRAAVGHLEPASLLCDRSSEGAALVTEQARSRAAPRGARRS